MRTLRTLLAGEARSAEAWLARLQSPDCTQAEREAFEQWRAAYASRSRDFTQAERIHRQASALAADPLLVASAKTARRRSATRAHRKQFMRRAAIPAVAAVALIFSIGYWRNEMGRVTTQHFATTTGEVRTLQLTDGSKVVLDTASAMTVRYSAGTREVTLEAGRAQFDVVHTAARPFTVHAGNGVIEDIGTRFQVRDQDGGATVTLIEGQISVDLPEARWHRTLKPGQEVSYHSDVGDIVREVDLADALGWTHGDLVFKDSNLGELVDEMNRYSQTKLLLGDDSLRTLTVSGVFHAGDQVSLVQALESGWSLQATQVAKNEIVLRSQHR